MNSILRKLVALAVLAAAGCPAASVARVTVTPARADARAAVAVEGGVVVIDVESAGGIGAAEVAVGEGTYPRAIVLRLYLAGLEAFGLEYGETALRAAVASGGDHAVRQEAAPGSPAFLDVRRGERRFEIVLPPALLSAAPRSFSFSWIDFYR